jgi:O-antigen/teichoic acid export membrane protein
MRNYPFIPFRITPNRTNLIWAGLIQVLEKLTGYLILAVLTRYLDKTDLGSMFFVAAISGVCATLINFGTDTHLIRAVAVEPHKGLEHLSINLSTRLRNSGLVYLLLNLTVYLISPQLSPVFLLISAYDFVEEIYYCFAAFFAGKKRLLLRLLTGGGYKLLTLGVVSGVAILSQSLLLVLVSYLILDILLVLTTYGVIRRTFGAFKLNLDVQVSLDLMRRSLPFALRNFLNLAHMQLDTFLVGVFLNLEQVANYSLGIKLLESTRFMVRPMYMAVYPVFSEMVSQRRWELLQRRTLQASAIVLSAGTLLAFGMQVLASRLIVYLFGPDYVESVVPVQILFLSVPFVFLEYMLSFVANALHLEKRSAWLLGAGVALNLSMNLYAIPTYGVIGAAWTTLITQVVLALGMAWLVRRGLGHAASG